MAAPKKKATTKKARAVNNSVDVSKTSDMVKIHELLKKNKLVVILVWADYCGHCHTFKDDVWKKLLANKNRRAGLASIHYDQLENAPEPIPKKVSGYPTVFLVKNNGAVEYPNPRDLAKMNAIVESEGDNEDPESLESQNTPSLTSQADNVRNEMPSADPQGVLNSIAENEPKNISAKTRATVPNPIKDDMLNSQIKSQSLNVEGMNSEPSKPVARGGSLYSALESIYKRKQTRSAKSKKPRHTRRAYR